MKKGNSVYSQRESFIGKMAFKTHSFAAQVFLLLMTGVIALEVFFRHFLGSGFTWSQEVCELSFFLLVFLCQPNCWQEDRHIRMDIFYNKFPPVIKKITNLLTIICGTILYGLLGWQGLSELEYQFSVNESSMELELPMWPFSLAMVFSCVVLFALLLRFLVVSLIFKSKRGES